MLKLHEECHVCEGSGQVYETDPSQTEECPECEGVGSFVTEDGRHLIDFLHKHCDLDDLLRLREDLNRIKKRLGD